MRYVTISASSGIYSGHAPINIKTFYAHITLPLNTSHAHIAQSIQPWTAFAPKSHNFSPAHPVAYRAVSQAVCRPVKSHSIFSSKWMQGTSIRFDLDRVEDPGIKSLTSLTDSPRWHLWYHLQGQQVILVSMFQFCLSLWIGGLALGSDG